MFPETNQTIVVTNTEPVSLGTKTFLFDFNRGDFVLRDGKLVVCDGIEAVKVWIEKIIRTEKNRYSIYVGTQYGCHLEDLIIGNNYTASFVESELKREIEEALLQNPMIISLSGFVLERDKGSITVTAEVNISDTGTDTVTVTVAD